MDVSSKSCSRHQPGFSRESLDKFLVEKPIRYMSMGDLLGGRQKDDDCNSDDKLGYIKPRGYFGIAIHARLNAAKSSRAFTDSREPMAEQHR